MFSKFFYIFYLMLLNFLIFIDSFYKKTFQKIFHEPFMVWAPKLLGHKPPMVILDS